MREPLRTLVNPASRTFKTGIFLGCLMLISCGQDSPPPVVNDSRPMLVLYASLPAERIANVAKAYADTSGVLVNYMLDSDEVLIEKLERKEHIPGADVLLLSGGGHLATAVDSDVLRPIASAPFGESVDATLRDPDGYWFGVGVRAEIIVYDRRSVDAESLGGYADLAGDGWRTKLCLQRSVSERSRSLIAALIAERGERGAELLVRGWRANLATSVFDEQRDMLLAVESGDCAVAIAGSDEVASFVTEGLADNLGIHFPPAAAGGTLQHVTAVGVARHANDATLATEFVGWLLSPAGQRVLHAAGSDYPANSEVDAPAPLDSWPLYSVSPVAASRSGHLYQDAILLAQRARYR